jgi:transposase
MRDQLLSVLAAIEPCTVAIEACTGAFCWARQFEELGHNVKIVSPQYVKPFVRRQKNDGNDAEAIWYGLCVNPTFRWCLRKALSNRISRLYTAPASVL